MENVVDVVTKYGNRVKTESSRKRNVVEHLTGLDSGPIIRGLTITFFICVCLTKLLAAEAMQLIVPFFE